ncbi:MAG TPA: bifunctional 5,10-methylenetetrahydrofolate dehydrogenase/5,10-methenyltetrahydrofolate cyclohydrolase, partial [Candidatus Limnocylindria bacterium]|nr:bifunctional 5,10-methylenetetrahydrofolate dehydrogenase/5,10-methenyltetrahydrofolate cyclohydrolase [Candidatus Limnocylindria bacterium]
VARLLHGRPLAERIKAETRTRVETLGGRSLHPQLAIVSVGADPAALTYTERLARSGHGVGVRVSTTALGREASEPALVRTLETLGADPDVHGIILMTPLPGALDEGHIVDHIAVEKDVEGMHPFSVGWLADGRPRFVPSTAEAVIELLRFYEIPMRGCHAVVVGRSTVIGRPVAYLLLREDATVTIAHRRTSDLTRFTRDADIVVVGTGNPGFLKGDMIRAGATVIDAGINVMPQGLVGDADPDSVGAVAGAFSPVPGGLGAVTAALLLRNVVSAAEGIARKTIT